MVATTASGRGPGGVVVNNSSILLAGIVDVPAGLTSPPTPANNITLPYPFPGGADSYVVLLTGIATGKTHVSYKAEDDDGNFISFVVNAENEGKVQYLVVSCGAKYI